MRFATSPDEVAQITDEAIARADALLAGVEAAVDDPTWSTVMAPLDEMGDVLVTADGRGGFLGYVGADPELRAAGRDADQRIQQWQVGTAFRDDLYAAVSAFAATDEAAGLAGERARFLEFVLRDLRRAGHELDPGDRAELEQASQRLVEVGVEFQRNLADHEDPLTVTQEELEGMPDSYVEGLAAGAEDGTYLITLAYPDVVPFMDQSPRRDLRRELDRRFNTRAVDANRPLLEEAIALRARIAELFDQPSWAHHRLEEKMAGDPAAVHEMYDELVPPLTVAGREEIAVIQAMLAEDLGDPAAVVQRYDWRYYHDRLSREQHGVDAAEVAAYFPLEQTVEGMFALTGDVFGLDYVPVEARTWHEDVRTFDLHDRATGDRIARFHMDLFPRDGTYGHAAAFTLVQGRRLPDGGYQQPESAIRANFTRPTATTPSLLRHTEVETLFHEFGHILHQVLTTAELARFSGTSVQRDFVEAPSQIMEHWTWQPDVLASFALHHATGAPIPEELVDAMIGARNLDVAIQKLRQVQFGVLDMVVHGPGATALDLDEVARDVVEMTLVPKPDDTFFPATLAHIVSSGYDAGYYGYLWAEVIGDAMFGRFATEGVTSPAVGAEYRREILEPGGTRDASELVEAFLGHEPTNEAFLTKIGIA